MCNNFDTFINENQYFLGFVEFRKKLLFFRIGCSTGLKHRILIILSKLKGWVFAAKNRYIIIGAIGANGACINSETQFKKKFFWKSGAHFLR